MSSFEHRSVTPSGSAPPSTADGPRSSDLSDAAGQPTSGDPGVVQEAEGAGSETVGVAEVAPRPTSTLEYKRAEKLRAQGDLRAALVDYERALEQSPTSVAILGRIADVLFDLGEYGDAQLRYRDALALASKPLPWAHIGIANTAERLGDSTRALGHLAQAVELSPDDTPLGLRFLRSFEEAPAAEQRRHAAAVVAVVQGLPPSAVADGQEQERLAYDLAVAEHLLGARLSNARASFSRAERKRDPDRVEGWFCDVRSAACEGSVQLWHDGVVVARAPLRPRFRHGRVGAFDMALPESVRDVPTDALELRVEGSQQRLPWSGPVEGGLDAASRRPTKDGAAVIPVSSVQAHVEAAWEFSPCNMTLVAGWGFAVPGASAWLESSSHATWRLLGSEQTGFRFDRPDIRQANRAVPPERISQAGFVTLLDGGPTAGELLELKIRDGDRRSTVDDVVVRSGPVSPIDAARLLHETVALRISDRDYVERIASIDAPLLGALIAAYQAGLASIEPRVETFGALPPSPAVAIVVPLYARFDLVDHQLAELARDPWLRAHGEIVYVVDDPAIAAAVWAYAPTLHRLYGVPFRLVDGRANRGYAAANNLGVAHSTAPVVIFLNSDAFPLRPGWSRAMSDALYGADDLGAVGARLLYPSGGIQHAGMKFRWRREWGIWTNEHPLRGLDPSLDPHRALAEVPAVTAACLAARREHLSAVGGFDTGYLVGDFEDSDLCLKLRERGLRVGYLPTVELVHLERQSFKTLGDGSFRFRVTLWNAVRHQRRWASYFESLRTEEGA